MNGSATPPTARHAGQHSDAPEAEAPEGEAESPAEETPPEDPALVEARDLYKQGEISFQTGEFTAALPGVYYFNVAIQV